MLLAELLAASERVAGTRSRLAKIDALAECLRRLDASEIALGVAYLSGDTRQGRSGIGYAALKDARAAAPGSAARLTLAHFDEALARLAQTKGEGSAAERARMLAELFARATAPEQDFLAREKRSEEHTSELQSHHDLVCRLLLEKKKKLLAFQFLLGFLAIAVLVKQ